jgi:hypothetical protein
MTDDHIRRLLRRQPRAEALPHPPGTVAILRQQVEAASADDPAVERWIGTHSGESRIAPAGKAAIQPAGGGMPRFEGPFRYYVIPLGALTGKPRAHPDGGCRRWRQQNG